MRRKFSMYHECIRVVIINDVDAKISAAENYPYLWNVQVQHTDSPCACSQPLLLGR